MSVPQEGTQPYGAEVEPKKSRNSDKKILGGAAGLVLLLVIAFAALGGEDDSTAQGTTDTSAVEPEPAVEPVEDEPVEEAEPAEVEEPAEKEPEPEEPADQEAVPEGQSVTIEATATEFQPSVLHDGGDFTSVEVTVVNNSEEDVEVNPLAFALVSDNGSKVNAELGMDERQIDTLTLAPGQQVNGVLTGEGAFTVASVEFKPDLFGGGDTYLGEVEQ